MLTAAVRDLKRAYPDIRLSIGTACEWLWENNPYIDPYDSTSKDLELSYITPRMDPSIDYHFIYAFHRTLERELDIVIPRGEPFPDLHLSTDERESRSAYDKPYILINAGHKDDYPLKQWPVSYFQKVADALKDRYTLIQIGSSAAGHRHLRLSGALDAIGDTPGRELVKVMKNAYGVVSGVSYPMHLCAALQHLHAGPRHCVVLGGYREPVFWERYPNQTYLLPKHPPSCGIAGGCWRRCAFNGSEVCLSPVRLPDTHFYAECLTSISPEQVINVFQSPDNKSV